MIENKSATYRDGFPGYMGHIPYKKETIGMTVGATNNHIKNILTVEPNKEEIMNPIKYEDFSIYNKDYFNENFCRDYKLEEDQIYSNTSKIADTWIKGSKYKIYPQHIPNYKAHVPGIYSSNIHGMGYSKSTAIAIKGDYCKKSDLPKEEKYKSTFKAYFEKPKIRSGIFVIFLN